MKCPKCNQEFTSKDQQDQNYSESMGVCSHLMCPGTEIECAICGGSIADFAQAKRSAGWQGSGWQHKSCKPVAIKRNPAREQALREEREESEGQPRVWNLRKH